MNLHKTSQANHGFYVLALSRRNSKSTFLTESFKKLRTFFVDFLWAANFENGKFLIFTSDLGFLRKSMIANWVFYFFIIGASASKLAKTANFWRAAHLFAYFDVFLDFNGVNIKI